MSIQPCRERALAAQGNVRPTVVKVVCSANLEDRVGEDLTDKSRPTFRAIRRWQNLLHLGLFSSFVHTVTHVRARASRTIKRQRAAKFGQIEKWPRECSTGCTPLISHFSVNQGGAVSFFWAPIFFASLFVCFSSLPSSSASLPYLLSSRTTHPDSTMVSERVVLCRV